MRNKAIIGHDITYQDSTDQGNEIAEIYVEQCGNSVAIDAYIRGELWAPWYAELNRFKNLDCGTEEAASTLHKQLTAGGQSSIDALASTYTQSPIEIATWFQSICVGRN